MSLKNVFFPPSTTTRRIIFWENIRFWLRGALLILGLWIFINNWKGKKWIRDRITWKIAWFFESLADFKFEFGSIFPSFFTHCDLPTLTNCPFYVPEFSETHALTALFIKSLKKITKIWLYGSKCYYLHSSPRHLPVDICRYKCRGKWKNKCMV